MLKKRLKIYSGIRVNFYATATYERKKNMGINKMNSMHLQTENYTVLSESNFYVMYQIVIGYILRRYENIVKNLKNTL